MSPKPKKSGSRKGRWARSELDQLDANYGTRADAGLARALGRPVASVREQAHSLFAAKPSRERRPWSAEEDERLKRCLGVAPASVMALVLRRPVGEIAERVETLSRASRRGPWSAEEVKALKALYGSREDEVLAVVFARPCEEIARLAAENRLAKDKAFLRRLAERLTPEAPVPLAPNTNGRAPRLERARMPRWTAEEVDLLRQLYPNHFNVAIAARLRKSCKAIMSKANDLGLRKSAWLLAEMGKNNVGIRYRRRSEEGANGEAKAGE